MKKFSYKFSSTLLACLLLFIANSFVSVVVFSICAIRKKENFSHFFSWGIFFALFVSLFNASKVPENDLAMYVNYFHLAEYMPLNKYIYILGDWGKDILYLAYTWIIHFFIGNFDKLFVFIMSFTSYFLFLKALLVGCKSLKLDTASIFLCLSFLFFHPYIFSTSAHILRQTIAFSIMSYVLAKKMFENKNFWYLGFVAALFHGSVLFFIPFLFVNVLYKSISWKALPLVLIGGWVVTSVKEIASFLRSAGIPISFFDFALRRASEGTTFDAVLDLKQAILSSIFVILLFILMYVKKTSLKDIPSYNYFLNLTALLFFFILINKDSGELQHRFNIFMWQMSPLFVVFFLGARNKVNSNLKILLSISLFGIWLVYNNFFSPWTYDCGMSFWFYPAFAYFI